MIIFCPFVTVAMAVCGIYAEQTHSYIFWSKMTRTMLAKSLRGYKKNSIPRYRRLNRIRVVAHVSCSMVEPPPPGNEQTLDTIGGSNCNLLKVSNFAVDWSGEQCPTSRWRHIRDSNVRLFITLRDCHRQMFSQFSPYLFQLALFRDHTIAGPLHSNVNKCIVYLHMIWSRAKWALPSSA